MGYSIAIRAKKNLREKMIKFMEKNYREAHTVFGYEYSLSSFAYNSTTEKGMSYDNAPAAMGFNYNSGMDEPERNYVFSVTRWMALKIGMVKKHPELGTIPYYVYDGGNSKDDYWAILIKSEWEAKVPQNYKWCLVNELGFKSMESCLRYFHLTSKILNKTKNAFSSLMGFSMSKANKKILDELNRLDELWKKEG